ncbi:chromate resistance protein [Desulfobacterales bacterium HSG2]|nr:chromate resistance protein [Desulfobacterales bacterium HSG2]
MIDKGIQFDTPYSEIRRNFNQSTFESMLKHYRISDRKLLNMGKLVRDIEIKSFCVDQAHSNVFLIHADSKNEKYQLVKKLIDLRFLHILHPGITPDKRNEKYEALLLDYAFYTGFRRTSAIKEFKEVPKSFTFKELRGLKKFKI